MDHECSFTLIGYMERFPHDTTWLTFKCSICDRITDCSEWESRGPTYTSFFEYSYDMEIFGYTWRSLGIHEHNYVLSGMLTNAPFCDEIIFNCNECPHVVLSPASDVFFSTVEYETLSELNSDILDNNMQIQLIPFGLYFINA